jgi:type II secretory pathway component GspD/PulD (secretin)
MLPLCGLLALVLAAASAPWAQAQSPANSPASIPAGADTPAPARPTSVMIPPTPSISAKQAREADDAYIQGAKQVEHKDLAAAEKSFARAVELNPGNRDYALALIVAREHHLDELVQAAAKQRLLGNNERADALLAEARKIDPDNAVIAQHFEEPISAPGMPHGSTVADTLGDAVKLTPKAGVQDVHLRGTPRDVIRSLYAQFGVTAVFDPSVGVGSPVRLEVDGVSFDQCARILSEMTHTFAVPMQPRSALIAADTEENRKSLQPQVEETVYMPGLQETQMQEMANLARGIFGLTSVTASPSTDTIVLRGDSDNLKVLNATYEGMLNGSSDVMLDINLYEIDRTNTRNIGLQLPGSAGVFSVTAEAEQLVSANQSIISQAIAAGLIKLTGNSITDLITEVGFLIASGTVSVAQYSNLLGIFGNGLSLAGLYVGSGSTFNLLLNSSDVRTLDAVQLRAGNNQKSTFRAGTRYPIVTSTYTTGLSSGIASAVSGLNINGTNVGSLLQQYLGTSSVTIPQIQYEDLGLTLDATPVIQRAGTVQLTLNLKIESLGGGSVNNIPILNNRQLSSTITIPAGQTALLASQVSTSETRDIQGVPGLSEIPGFQSTTDDNKQTSSGELLMTITPHIVREGGVRIASRPLLLPYNPGASAQSFMIQEQIPPPPPQQHNPQIPTGTRPQNPLAPRTLAAPGTAPPQQPTTTLPE